MSQTGPCPRRTERITHMMETAGPEIAMEVLDGLLACAESGSCVHAGECRRWIDDQLCHVFR